MLKCGMLIIKDKRVELEEPYILSVNKMMRHSKGKYWHLVNNILNLIVKNYDESISIQEAIHILAFYRATTWHDIPIYKTSKDEVLPSELISKEYSEEEETFLIGKELFRSAIPLKEALLAEDYAVTLGEESVDMLAELTLACACKKGFMKGYEILQNVKSNPITLGKYTSLLEAVEDYGAISLRLNSRNDRPISLITSKEFPFRSSLLFSI